MLYRLINKEKGIDGLIEINCSTKTMEHLINKFKSEIGLKQDLLRFVEWINATTPYAAQLLANQILFDF